jgi:Erv1 / Alr family
MDQEAEWFAAFLKGLPCPKCRHHFEAFLNKNPTDFTSRPAFFAWTVRAHNFVNQSNGRPELLVDEALRLHQFEEEKE